MTVDLKRFGIWSSELTFGDLVQATAAAAELDELGFGALWAPGGLGDPFPVVRDLLDATKNCVIATGIVSIFAVAPADVAARVAELEADHPDRFLLGLGVSHPELVDPDGPSQYVKPLAQMSSFLDELDRAPTPVAQNARVLAALGPKMLELAGAQAGGAHPYLVTPSHTAHAREVLGPERILAPTQAVMWESDPERARTAARKFLRRYLGMTNYRRSWVRQGFDEADADNGGSDRLIDALVAWGTPEQIVSKLDGHLAAGADHVCIQVLAPPADGPPIETWRRVAETVLDR